MAGARIIIVEDEPIIAADLGDRLAEMGYTVAGSFDTGEAALAALPALWPDLILLDIHLAGELDGVDTALLIREQLEIPLIFLTSNSDDATFSRAREARPSAFLSKPFRSRDLVHAVDLALGAGRLTLVGTVAPPAAGDVTPDFPEGETAMLFDDRLFLKVKDRLSRIMLEDVLWVEADDYYCKVHTNDRDYLVTKTLKKFSELLPPDAPFMRCHRSYLVNLRQVTEIGDVFLQVGHRQLPVSRSRRAELLARISGL